MAQKINIIIVVLSMIFGAVKGCTTVTPADVIFLVDESRSVGDANFRDTMNALAVTVDDLAIGENEIRVGVVLFHAKSTARSLTDLNNSFDKSGITSILLSATFAAGNDTDIASALNYTCNVMLTEGKGERSSAQNYIILISDGKSDAGEAKYVGGQCKDSGNIIISVQIGETTEQYAVLKDLASNYPDNFLNTTYEDLGTTLTDMVTTKVVCSYSSKHHLKTTRH